MPGIITQGYMEALGKQVFARDFILNGLFPCQSDIMKMIMLKKVAWKFNDKFEYRMLLSNTNSAGTINSQTLDSNFRSLHPGHLEYGTFQATFGTFMDSFNIDMLKQLETRESRAAFNLEYGQRLHSLRMNIASIAKNFIIHGRYGTAHRIMPPLGTKAGGSGSISAGEAKYVIQYGTPDPVEPGSTAVNPFVTTWSKATWNYAEAPSCGYWELTLNRGDHVRIVAPSNVFASNFKNGRLISRATVEKNILTGNYNVDDSNRRAPWGKSQVREMYVVLENQPRYMELVYIGSGTISKWYAGDFLEVAGNRAVDSSTDWRRDLKITLDTAKIPGGFNADTRYTDSANPSSVAYWKWCKQDGSDIDEAVLYTEQTGAMEGLADLFPWYTAYGDSGANPTFSRLGLDRFFRGQVNRLRYTTEQAGTLIFQEQDMTIMDCLMIAVELAQSVCDWEDLVIWINPTTLASIGMYEQLAGGNMGGLQVYKEANVDSKLIYQRGITGMSYKLGEKIIPTVLKDPNLPTDIILLAPLRDISYNCWDNAAFEMNQYIQNTWSGKKPPDPKVAATSIPKEFVTKLDLSSRITYGAPVAADLLVQGLGASDNYNGFVHPSNSIPVAYHEMGNLFTENPYAYTVVKLRNQIVNPNDTVYSGWAELGKNVKN